MDRYYQASIATNAFTSINAPLTTVISLENALLLDIEILIPAGHTGLTGVRVRFSQQQVLPFGSNSWIVADDYLRIFDINQEVGSKTVSVQTYNNDIYQHTFYLRFHIRELSDSGIAGVSRAPIVLAETIDAGLEGAVDLSTGQPVPPPAPPTQTLPPPPPLPVFTP